MKKTENDEFGFVFKFTFLFAIVMLLDAKT